MKRILVVGAEPGSANTLGPILKRVKGDFQILGSQRVVEGFKHLGFAATQVDDPKTKEDTDRVISQYVEQFQPEILLSTLLGPLETSLDHGSRRVCAGRKIRHVAVLDSWMNLDSRFDFVSRIFPTVVAVPDEMVAREISALGVPENIIKATGHPFFDEIVFQQKRNDNLREVVLLLQPIQHLVQSAAAPYPGYGTEEVTELVFAALDRVSKKHPELKLILREHPRFPSSYRLPPAANYQIEVSTAGDGWEMVQNARVALGMSSTLLIYSFLAGIPTIVVQPGLSIAPDPNILTGRSILPNCQNVAMLTQELEQALSNPHYQRDRSAQSARKSFFHDAQCSERVIQLLDDT